MLAAFLKTEDGDFNFPAALVSLVLAGLMCFGVVQIYRALQQGRTRFLLSGYNRLQAPSPVRYHERATDPFGFWFAIMFYAITVLLYLGLIMMICFGWLRKSS